MISGIICSSVWSTISIPYYYWFSSSCKFASCRKKARGSWPTGLRSLVLQVDLSILGWIFYKPYISSLTLAVACKCSSSRSVTCLMAMRDELFFLFVMFSWDFVSYPWSCCGAAIELWEAKRAF